MCNWIDIKDRLPEANKLVDCFSKSQGKTIGWRLGKGWKIVVYAEGSGEHYPIAYDITKWKERSENE